MRAAAVIALLTLLIAGAWVGGELHYRNCVDTARANPPIRHNPFDWWGNGTVNHRKLDQKVAGCSRLP